MIRTAKVEEKEMIKGLDLLVTFTSKSDKKVSKSNKNNKNNFSNEKVTKNKFGNSILVNLYFSIIFSENMIVRNECSENDM